MSQYKHRSLFLRLLLGFLGVMLGIWLCLLVWDIYETRTYAEDTEQDTKFLTQQILAFTQTVSEKPEHLIRVIKRVEQLREAPFKERNLYAPHLHIQVWKNQKQIYSSLAGLSEALPPPGDQRRPNERAWASWTETDSSSGITVRIAQEITGKWAFTISSVGYYLLPIFYSFPFLILPAGFIIMVGLRPLQSITTEIEERSASDFTPLENSPYKELSPLVDAINRLMKRLTERMEREQEFLLDAAHELKTPLAIIQINADSLISNSDPKRLMEANYGLHQGVTRATHTVHQLLALARSGADRDQACLQQMDMVELLSDRLALAAPIALQRAIEIELQSPDVHLMQLHRESVVSLIDNLISNAVKYSPHNGRIVVNLMIDADNTQLTIADEGPGIPVDLRKKVFERFFRLPGQDQPGSGLGLAIAERAAARNNASIALDAKANGTSGLEVRIQFQDEATEPA